jgi:hypothetical protein
LGNLAAYLQREFSARRPLGWTYQREVRVLSPQLENVLGYSPRVDVLLEKEDGSRRLWIEFEISRADPVANHAKFATTQLFQPQTVPDVFLAMVSPHVDRGRNNLAANMIWVMRYIGMRAYQTVLLPHTSPLEIKRLNHLVRDCIAREVIDIESEIQRALTVSDSLLQTVAMDIHFVANLMEVMLNLNQWNHEVMTESGQRPWGKRTVTYFVCDLRSRQFAPSKFCAYVSIPALSSRAAPIAGSAMTVQNYVQIEKADPIFDGQRAVHHLIKNLAMVRVEPDERPDILPLFNRWLAQHNDSINVHPAGPVFFMPPEWF